MAQDPNLDQENMRRKRERFTYTVIPSQRMDSRIWRISKMMMNMRS